MTKTNKQNGLVPFDRNLDLVPTSLEAEIIASSGNHTENYLIENCLVRGITKRQLYDVIELKEQYQTNLPTIFSFMDEGYNLEEINGFLEVRELLSTKKNTVSVSALSRFCDKFGYDPVDTETVQGKVEETHQLMNREFYGTSLDNFIDLAESFETGSYELVLGFLENLQSSQNSQRNKNSVYVAGNKGYISSSNCDDFSENSNP